MHAISCQHSPPRKRPRPPDCCARLRILFFDVGSGFPLMRRRRSSRRRRRRRRKSFIQS